MRRPSPLVIAGATFVVASAMLAGLLWWQRSSDSANAAPVPHQGRFVVDCGYVGSRPDDPIVFPGQFGASHLHDFFGAVGVDADTEAEDLRGADTSCETKQDTASYWSPALLTGDGEQVEPIGSDAYYRAAPGVDPAEVEPFPFGLQIIGGDAASREAQPTEVVGWGCGPNPRRQTTPPPCNGDNPLVLRVTFPDCWDGRNLGSADHQSHMARSDAEGCPTSHPVAVPQLELVVEYPAAGLDVDDLRLASGSVETAHADFYNAWDEQKLAEEVRYCLQADVICGAPSI